VILEIADTRLPSPLTDLTLSNQADGPDNKARVRRHVRQRQTSLQPGKRDSAPDMCFWPKYHPSTQMMRNDPALQRY